MSPPEIAAIIGKIKMRGVIFEYIQSTEGPMMIPCLAVRMTTPDVDHPNIATLVQNAMRFYDWDLTEQYIIEQAHRLARKLFEHEVDELFRYDGKKIFDPHRKNETPVA